MGLFHIVAFCNAVELCNSRIGSRQCVKSGRQPGVEYSAGASSVILESERFGRKRSSVILESERFGRKRSSVILESEKFGRKQ